jgi:hypothetical protein
MNCAARRMELDAVAIADAVRIGTEFLTEIAGLFSTEKLAERPAQLPKGIQG